MSNQVKVLEPDVQHYEERAELEIRVSRGLARSPTALRRICAPLTA